MKKKILTILLLISSIFILSSCGETEDDKINSTDPKKFALATIKEEYDIDVEVVSHETKYFRYTATEFDYEYELFEFKTKDENPIIFKVATYWEVSDALPTRHYNLSTDYENIINKNIVEAYFAEKDIKLTSYQDETKRYNYTPAYRFTIKPTTLDNLANVLYDLSRNEKLYNLSIKVNYNDKNVNIELNNNTELSTIEKKINQLQ